MQGGPMRLFLAACLILFTSSSILAQWSTVGAVDSVLERGPQSITVRAGQGVLQAWILADDLIRIRFSPSGKLAEDFSWAVLPAHLPPVHADISESPSALRIATPRLVLLIMKNPLRLRFLDADGNVINEDDSLKGISWCGTEVRTWKRILDGERYYGFGEKAGRFERTWHHMTMWNSDIPAYTADTDPLYQSIPFFYGIRHGRAYGIFFDNPYRSSFDMGKESGTQYSFGAEAGEMNYYFFAGPSPKAVLARFTELVGRMPLPPRWSLGFQQSRWSYPTEQRVREIANGFRSRKIPCDVIYLDIDYMDGYRIFTWNTKNFPDPARMIADLGKDGFKVAVIVDPGIKVDSTYPAYRSGLAGKNFVTYPDGRVFTGKVWPGVCAFPDFASTQARRWWGGQFSGLVAAGVRGWWNDMNEPSVFDVPTKTIDLNVVHDADGRMTTHAEAHNIYGLEMTRATYDGVRALLPDERPFVLTRASYAGGARYSAAWTGDNVSSWEHLRLALTICLNFGISGQPFVGSDIGGFIGNPSGELFARWLQLGVFTPLMRAHSEITAKNKEPWVYGDQFTAINRKAIELRYRLLPLIYNVMYQASVTGLPAMRPLIFEYPDREEYGGTDDEFLFGDDILVAPVLNDGQTSRSVSLPPGLWYNYWNDSSSTGGKSITVAAPINRIPFFVRAGAVIPSQQLIQFSSQATIDPLTLTVYCAGPGKTDSSLYYEDDGHSFAYTKGVFFRRSFSQSATASELTFAASASDGSYDPPGRSLLVRFVGYGTQPSSVTLNGKILPGAKRGMIGATGSWEYDAAQHVVTVRMPETRERYELVLKRGR
jgi:alpha-glucosidase